MHDQFASLEKNENSSSEPASQSRSIETWSHMKPTGLSDLQIAQSKQMHQQGLIDFSQVDDIWSTRRAAQDKNFHRDIAAHIKDAVRQYILDDLRKPKDGDSLTLKEFLDDYDTPIGKAYNNSRQLEDGTPGKSKTLEHTIERLKACPWANEIRICFKNHPINPEYDDRQNRITVDLNAPPGRQIENFVHEAFHATHQFLYKQFMHGKLSEKDYVNMWLDAEADSMLAETAVHKELELKGAPPRFSYSENSQTKEIDLQSYTAIHGKLAQVRHL